MPEAIAIRAAAGPGHGLQHAVRWLIARLRRGRTRPRQLRLCETLALGERRFLAVVEFERQRLLIGGTATSLALLTTLPERQGAESIAGNRNQERKGRQD